MKQHRCNRSFIFLVLVFAVIALGSTQLLAQPDPRWKQHDTARPVPPIINPGTASTQEQPGKPPSDAIVLFDGKDLSQWAAMDGEPVKWVVRDGAMEAVPGSGYVRTLRNFGDCQLHVEWAAPIKVIGKSQGRGNSGVFLMNRYEIQVLDSYDNVTYADGQAAALYGQYPPLVNAARPPGQWQTYDIIFTRPRFGADGKMVSPARFTILHNGVLVQHNVEAVGPTTWMRRPPYEAHADKLPLSLQDHGNPVRYRNIWIRELGSDALGRPEHSYSAKLLNNLAGSYRGATIALENGQLIYKTGSGPNETIFPLFAESPTRFFMKSVDAQIRFELDGTGKAMKLFFSVGGGDEEGRERRN